MAYRLLKNKIGMLASDKKFYEILTGSAWALSARILSTGLGLVTMIIIAKQYGAEVIGILAVMNSFFLFATIFTVLGTNTSILRLIPEYIVKYSPSSAYQLYKKILSMVMAASIFVALVLFLSSSLIADKIFSKPHLGIYFTLCSIFVLFNALMRLNTQAVRGLRLIKEFAVMQIIPSLSNLVFIIALTSICFSKDTPIYAFLASLAFTGILGWIIVIWTFRKRISPKDVIVPIASRNILSISLPMLMTNTMSFIIGQTGVLMLGMYKSEADVGHYSIAVKLATLTAFSLQAINSMAAPKFSELYHSGKIDDLFHVAEKSARLIFWTSAPILFGLILFGKPVLHFCFGREFIIVYPALLILISGQFVGAISGSCGNFMNMTGNHKAFQNLIMITTFANILLNLLFIPLLGIIGAAITSTICTIFLNISLLFFMKRKYGRTTGFFPLWGKFSSLWIRSKK